MHFEKLRKGIPFELGYPHINRPGSLILVNPLWPHGFFCSWKENERKMKGTWKEHERKMKGKWKENERKMKGKWKENESNEQPSGLLIRSRVPQTLLTLLTLWGGLLIRCWHYASKLGSWLIIPFPPQWIAETHQKSLLGIHGIRSPAGKTT